MKTAKLPVLFCLLSGILFPLFGRDVEIIVQDADLGIPLEGALVRSWDGSEHTCDEQGRVMLTVPDERPARVSVSYPGYENAAATVSPAQTRLSVVLRLAEIMENQELVIEAKQEGASVPGRGVSIGGGDLARTAETGLVEDVMTSLKLLPGVGYTGFFDAMPSIRGGEPGDLTAVLDGFYIENPYHWGGAYSIFDPRMTESARLSHGVFSARYGHTISGLLEIAAKKPSPEKTGYALSVSTNALDFSLSTPLGKTKDTSAKGGVMVMGKLTWWQPFIELAHLFMPISRNVKQAPWIASGAVSANYRFSPGLEWQASGFYGGDGIGFSYENEVDEAGVTGISALSHFFDNQIGFLNTGLTINPLNTMVIKAGAGAGVSVTNAAIDREDQLTIRIRDANEAAYSLDLRESHTRADRTVHAQGRFDIDWDLGGGFLVAAGAHERYSLWAFDQQDRFEPAGIAGAPSATASVHNHGFATAGYALGEFAAPGKRFGAELGLRLDHFYLQGEDFSAQTAPVLNPRLNLDFAVLKTDGFLESLDMTLGAGLFSAVDTSIHYLEAKHGVGDFDLLPNRSWTSLAGTTLGFSPGITLNIEGYYKYVFQRAYRETLLISGSALPGGYRFDGTGHIWGADVLLQKTESPYWDGWVSYSVNFARYHDPDAAPDKPDWYYPAFHRFHAVNLALNIKPSRQFHIAVHVGFTSGKPQNELGAITAIPAPANNLGINTLYTRTETYSDSKRAAFSLPLDIKCTWYLARAEIYFGIENILALALPSLRTTTVNRYTGTEEELGGMAVMTQLSMPLPSFGVKWQF
jgi:hypothetical protein